MTLSYLELTLVKLSPILNFHSPSDIDKDGNSFFEGKSSILQSWGKSSFLQSEESKLISSTPGTSCFLKTNYHQKDGNYSLILYPLTDHLVDGIDSY